MTWLGDPSNSAAPWIRDYYAAIYKCVERYRAMAVDRQDLLSFLDEFTPEVPLVKLSRWLGYVQGILIERGKTTVKAERDWTRPLFRPLDFADPAFIPKLDALIELMPRMMVIAPLPWEADIDDRGKDTADWTGKFYTRGEGALATWLSYETPSERLVPIIEFVEATVNAVPALLGMRFPHEPKNESELALATQPLIDAWNRGELAKWEFETAMKKAVDDYWASRSVP